MSLSLEDKHELASNTEMIDSLAYWRARHEQYLDDPRGVGNVTLGVSENERIYQATISYIENLVMHLEREKPVRVLELGCGTGMLVSAFTNTGCKYTGVDISDKAIEIARTKHLTEKFQVGNIAALPLSEQFDIILERTVFIHLIEDHYWRAVIKEVKRLLDRNGVFILMDHIPTSSHEMPGKAPHVKFRIYEEYCEVFQQANLRFDLELRQQLSRKITLSPYTHFVTHSS